MTSLAITVVGHDRPGIIAQAAEVLSHCGMNLEDSSMTLLRGHFAMTLICAGDADSAEVEAALEPLVNGSLYATLTSRYGLRLASGTRTAEAVLADQDQADLMSLVMPAPLLLIEQLTFLEDGAAIEYSRILYRGDRYRVPVK